MFHWVEVLAHQFMYIQTHFPFFMQFGHVLRDCTSWSSQESYSPAKGAASHGEFTVITFPNTFVCCIFSTFQWSSSGLIHTQKLVWNGISPIFVACFLGGTWQAFPDPEAVPGREAISCQIPSVPVSIPAPRRQTQPQLPHQLLQQFRWRAVPGTTTSRLLHTCVTQMPDITAQHTDKPTKTV